jgi:putative ATP-binding cassette transporter
VEEVGAHRLFATFTDDIPTVTAIISSLPPLLTQLAIVAGCLVYLGWLSRQLLPLVVCYMFLGILSYQLPLKKSMREFRLLREELDSLFKALRGVIDGIKELKLNRQRRRAFFLQEIVPTTASIRRYNIRGSTLNFAAGQWGAILFSIFIGLIIFEVPAIMKIDRHVMTGYALTVLYMHGPLDAILATLPNLGRARIAFEKIERLGLSLSDQGGEEDEMELAPRKRQLWKSIELLSVAHSYRHEGGVDSFMLGPLDIVLHPGEIVFLIGGNGSGKTTLAKVLAGLYAPESGEIRIDGEPVTIENRDDYRQHFSAIFSDFYLFDKLFGLDCEWMDDKLQDYLIRLQLDHKVQVKDGELSTLDLSQGQRKRLALLTACLEDRSIYLFDEWAADQDPLFKVFFYCQFLPELKAQGKTLLVISHDDRFYHVADRVVKLERGQLETVPCLRVSGNEIATPMRS